MRRLAALLLIGMVLAVASDGFLTAGNLFNLARQTSFLFIIASGATLVILAGGIDLSVGANLGLSAAVAATVIKATGSAALGILAAPAFGLLIGLINGCLVAVLRVPAFIATYGMLWVVQGLTYLYLPGGAIYGFPPEFRAIGTGSLLGLPVPVLVMGIFLAIGGLLLHATTFGQDIYAIGANPEASRLSGIPLRRRLVALYGVSGAMAGLAAVIYLARVNSAEAGIGEPLLLPAIAAVLVGGTSLMGGVGGVTGTLVGAAILTLLANGMNLLTIDAAWQPLATGVIVLLAVAVDMLSRRRLTVRSR